MRKSTDSHSLSLIPLPFSINIILYSEMDNLLHFFSSSAADRALERLQTLNLHSDDYTDFKEVQTLIKKKVRSESQLGRYLKASNRIASTPQTIIKQAIFYHVFLQHARKVDQDNAITLMNNLLLKCQEVARQYGQGQSNDTYVGSHCRNICLRSQVSTREDQTFLGKQIFLLSKIGRPYIKYIMRLIAIYDDYCTLDGKETLDFSTAWHLINLLRSVTSFTNHFVMIGRYFMKDYGPLIVLLTETLNNDLIRYMQCLNRFIRQQNYMLSCSTSHTEESQTEIGEFVNLMKELTGINEELMQIYLGRYFYREFKDLKKPEWVNINCSEFDTIFKIAEGYSKN